jgi:hypothetical protein
MSSKLAVIGLFAALGFASSAQAAITTYSDQSSFLAAISVSVVDSFSNLANGVGAGATITRLGGSSNSYTAGAPNGLYSISNGQVWLTTAVATDALTLSGFASNPTAIGGFFFTTDVGGAADGLALTITATAADGSTTTDNLLTTSASTFVGFTSSSAIKSLVFSVPAAVDGLNGYATVKNLTLGTIAAVPEPGSYAMLLAGLGVLGMARRRRS